MLREMTPAQKKTAGFIQQNWPDAEIAEHDAGCFSVRVPSDYSWICARLPHGQYGVCVMQPGADGLVEIQF